MPAYHELVDFLAKGTTSQDIIDFHPSVQAQQRLNELLSKDKDQRLTQEEQSELDHYLMLEHVMRMAKARARKQQEDE